MDAVKCLIDGVETTDEIVCYARNGLTAAYRRCENHSTMPFHGTSQLSNEFGVVSLVTAQDGILHGPYEWMFYGPQELRKGNFRHGKRHGPWIASW